MAAHVQTLVIGLSAAALREDGVLPDDAVAISLARLADFSADVPEVGLVVAPLFCADCDALEIIEALGKLGFCGRLRIVSPKLPSRQIVLRELRAEAARQGITLELLETG